MSDDATRSGSAKGGYTGSFEKVQAAELEYLKRCRAANKLPEPKPDRSDLDGICLSGGGIRSATFCLGVMQRLIGENKFKQLDYLSTVSGGGYIGSCLSSLLTGDRRRDGRAPDNPVDNPEDPLPGVEPDNSPFVRLNRDDEDDLEPRLGVRQQIHHLRTHSEYLAPRHKLLSFDVQRAIGAFILGMIHNFLLIGAAFVALVATTHLVLSIADPGLSALGSLEKVEVPPLPDDCCRSALTTRAATVMQHVAAWWAQRLLPLLEAAYGDFFEHGHTRYYAFIGAVWVFVWRVRGASILRKLRKEEAPNFGQLSGWTYEEQLTSRFLTAFNVLSVAAPLALVVWACWRSSHEDGSLYTLLIPAAFSLGGGGVAYALNWWESMRERQIASGDRSSAQQGAARRSIVHAIQGASVYGLVSAFVIPAAIIVLMALKNLTFEFFGSLVVLAVLYRFAARQADTTNEGGWLGRMAGRMVKPLTNAGVIVALVLTFAVVSRQLIERIPDDSFYLGHALAFLVAVAVLFVLGTSIDSNRVSLHTFYRDRLSEAYLTTTARRKRKERCAGQGRPLNVIRDDDELLLEDLGKDNGRGPYHLIVAALNLSGSRELTRRNFLSDHFIFSRDYIGSDVTGYVKTSIYRERGVLGVKLARAMTISAAAAGSAVGYHTFWGQAFLATLFNLRLGHWMENPWSYCATDKPARGRFRFWPWWLGIELLALTTARRRMVNLSDGGHTGDNLGLMPLLRRRCRRIVVCDGEADGGFSFPSFNNAIRMAWIERNIRIEIDLADVQEAHDTRYGHKASKASVVQGVIHYPADSNGATPPAGTLIYVKASIPDASEVPAHVHNYAKENADFPHQTTIDQFFDDAQFEAYRALGHHVAGEAASLL